LRFGKADGTFVDGSGSVTLAGNLHDYIIANIGGTITLEAGTFSYPWEELSTIGKDRLILMYREYGKWTSSHVSIKDLLNQMTKNIIGTYDFQPIGGMSFADNGDVTISNLRYISPKGINIDLAAPVTVSSTGLFDYLIASVSDNALVVEKGTLTFPWNEVILNTDSFILAFRSDGRWNSTIPAVLSEIERNENILKAGINCTTAAISFTSTAVTCAARFSNGRETGWYEALSATLTVDPSEAYQSLILTFPNTTAAPSFGTFSIETVPHFYFNQMPSLNERRILFAYKDDGRWNSTIPAVVKALHEFNFHADTAFVVTEKIIKTGGTVGVDCDYTGIKSALDDITDNSAINRYVLRVKNGTYDVSADAELYLGFKNYVDLIGQTRNGVKVIKRIASDNPTFSTFDPAYYGESIQYASLRNMTIISHNSKCPVHIDGNELNGTIEIIDCNLINENIPGQQNYQNGLACGLRQNQHVRAIGCYSNGMLWAHNQPFHYPGDGCSFELYNCIMPFATVGDLLSYGKDRFIMEGCKTNFLRYLYFKNYGGELAYSQPSFEFSLRGNSIEYVEAVTTTDGSVTWISTGFDELYGGKHSICDSSIHQYCKNVSGTTIAKGSPVKLDSVIDMNGVSAWGSGSKFYGVALDEILAGEFGIVQYKGSVLLSANASTAIAFEDEIELNSSCVAVKHSSGTTIGYAKAALASGTGFIRIKLI
jgi:hypothetical protein